jgi:hypothetical protein
MGFLHPLRKMLLYSRFLRESHESSNRPVAYFGARLEQSYGTLEARKKILNCTKYTLERVDVPTNDRTAGICRGLGGGTDTYSCRLLYLMSNLRGIDSRHSVSLTSPAKVGEIRESRTIELVRGNKTMLDRVQIMRLDEVIPRWQIRDLKFSTSELRYALRASEEQIKEAINLKPGQQMTIDVHLQEKGTA